MHLEQYLVVHYYWKRALLIELKQKRWRKMVLALQEPVQSSGPLKLGAGT